MENPNRATESNFHRDRMCCDTFVHLSQKEKSDSGFIASLTDTPTASTPSSHEGPTGPGSSRAGLQLGVRPPALP